MKDTYDEIVGFHGHSCPGLAIGYRMSVAALRAISGKKSDDEELVAIVENNACGVDALQCLTGCTFGKGNLIFKDYGKHVYTIFSRDSKKAIRVVFNHKNIPHNLRSERSRFTEWLLTQPEEELVTLKEVKIKEPETARIMDTVTCAYCGEGVMKTRSKDLDNRVACIPCWEQRAVV